MMRAAKPITILMADDDPDDRQMTREAFEESRLANDLRFVEDGVELMDYLCRRNQYAEPDSSPRPGLILLDLNMPKKDGRQALSEIKAHPQLRNIRVVVDDDFEGGGRHFADVRLGRQLVRDEARDFCGLGGCDFDDGPLLVGNCRASQR